jgi:transcriptional regulator with XRE-family HTH domain
MTPPQSILPLAARRALVRLGTEISAARRRRRLPLDVVAERALTTRQTVARVERGDPGVAVGTVAAVLFALGLVERLGGVAAPSSDSVGLALEEERLPTRVRRARPPGARPAPLGTPTADRPAATEPEPRDE